MKKKTSFTLSIEALALLHAIAARKGISMASVLEQMIRETARRMKIDFKP